MQLNLTSSAIRRRAVALVVFALLLVTSLTWILRQITSRDTLDTIRFESSGGTVTVYNQKGWANFFLLETQVKFEVNGTGRYDLSNERLTSYDGFRSFGDDYENGVWSQSGDLVFQRKDVILEPATVIVTNTSGKRIRVLRIKVQDTVLIFGLSNAEERVIPIRISSTGAASWMEVSGRFDDGSELGNSGKNLSRGSQGQNKTQIRLAIRTDSVDFNFE